MHGNHALLIKYASPPLEDAVREKMVKHASGRLHRATMVIAAHSILQSAISLQVNGSA